MATFLFAAGVMLLALVLWVVLFVWEVLSAYIGNWSIPVMLLAVFALWIFCGDEIDTEDRKNLWEEMKAIRKKFLQARQGRVAVAVAVFLIWGVAWGTAKNGNRTHALLNRLFHITDSIVKSIPDSPNNDDD
ncbi:MAG: hypothetical protein JWL77_1492 [Chthonomonadaceae bacterium]|nr:hypothetical protein [Chthonomonadaceae bacterium]